MLCFCGAVRGSQDTSDRVRWHLGGPCSCNWSEAACGTLLLLALLVRGYQEAARVSEAYTEAKTFLKEGLGCLSHRTSGATQRQHTFWKGELTGKTLPGSRVNHCFDVSDNLSKET